MKKSLLLITLLCAVAISFAAEPAGRLFHIDRSKNNSYVCYDVNQKNGKLDIDEPMTVYWINPDKGGARNDLSFIQRKLAFGYKVIKEGNNEVTVTLKAYNKVPLKICQRNGKWVALGTLQGKETRITKLYVKSSASNSLHVEYVDIYGVVTATGASIKVRITK